MRKEKRDAVYAAVMGHAVADALGVPVEFYSRKELAEAPVAEMRGEGTYGVPRGSWSDDTSMALCALDSLEGGAWDMADVMRRFALWYTEGEYTPFGEMFDVGGTCSAAIGQYLRGKGEEDWGQKSAHSCGNGALMRLYPFVLSLWLSGQGEDWEGAIDRATALTHAHPRALLASRVYARVLLSLLMGKGKDGAREALLECARRYGEDGEAEHFRRLFSPDFEALEEEEIRSSGYAVDTLEAALWCLFTTSSYAEAVLRAVNLGEDTDTVAAVAGAMAGVLYGKEAIPEEWRSSLLGPDLIQKITERFLSAHE